MARARNIKPSFFTNDILAEVPALGRILFQGLWCVADREGRLEDRPKKLKAEILPYDDCDIENLLLQLSERGFIQRYQANGQRFIQVVNFTKHQNPHVKEAPSLIPAPDEHSASTVQASEIPERAGLIPDSGFRIPDSPKQAASLDQPETREAHPAAAASPHLATVIDRVTHRATELVLLLRHRGAAIQAGDPRVRSWAQRGITDAQALQALEVAQQRRHEAADPKPINAGYLDAILGDAGVTPSNRSPPGRMSREDSRRIAASTRLSDFRAACAAEQQEQTDDSSAIEGTATRLLG